MNIIEADSLYLVAPRTLAQAKPGIFALVGRSISDVERDLVLATLKQCLGNRTWTAKVLGISIRTMRNKLHEYASMGLDIPAPANQVLPPSGRRS